MNERFQQRGRVGYLVRKHGQDHPAVIEARGDLAVVVISAAIRQHLSKVPPLSERQKAKLRDALERELGGGS